MKDPLIIDEEKKITKEDIKKEKELKETQKAIENLGYKEDPYLNSNCLSKLFFIWVFRTIRVKTIIFTFQNFQFKLHIFKRIKH